LELLEKFVACPMHTKHNQMPKTWEAGINNYFEKGMNLLFAFFKRNKSSEKRLFPLLGILQFCYLLGLVIKGELLLLLLLLL
jgi:hypothetical protein